MAKKKELWGTLIKIEDELTQNATSKPTKPKVEKTYQLAKAT